MIEAMGIEQGAPFVLIDLGDQGLLHTAPAKVLMARRSADVSPALEELRRGTDHGLHAAGFLSYEAGYALEPRLAPLGRQPAVDEPPLLWFGLFASVEEVDLPGALPDPRSAWTDLPRPLISRDEHGAAVAEAKTHIEAGNVYQVNVTFPASINVAGHPLALFAGLRERARAGHGGIVFTGDHWLLSLSPELFFTLSDGKLVTRPMKGTAKRGSDPAADAAAVAALQADPKQRAENLMIVDLLRNDLARVSSPGTVKVPSLFEIETYPTIHQMTSTITAALDPGLGPVDVIRTIFPCGSITGAPKIRAMEIIADIERVRRGAYTGSIGTIAPNGNARFNVAIRTLTMKAGETQAIIGLGSGIVADSNAEEEWRECLAKGAFVSDPDRSFDLIETMRFDPHEGIAEIERHLRRMKKSAEELGFSFDRHGARNELQAATFRLREPRIVRLLLSRTGAVAIEARPLPPSLRRFEAALVPLPVSPQDFRLRHKTSDRAFYDGARQVAGTSEVVFHDEAGFLTEGSFTSLFVEREGRLLTPPLSRGLLPGILRERLLESGEAEEADLVAADLVNGFYLGNSIREMVPAVLRAPDRG